MAATILQINSASTSQNSIHCIRSGVEKFLVSNNDGSVYNASGTYGIMSILKLKIDITTARDYTEDFKKIEFVN